MPSWKGKSRGGAFGYRFFIFLIKILGIRFAYFFLIFVATHFIFFAPAATRSVWYYNRKILKYSRIKSFYMLYVNYYAFGQVIIDKVAVKSGLENKYQYKFDNYEKFLEILNRDTGVIMIGAHIGNWEIGSTFFGEYEKKMNIVMMDAEYRKIKEVLHENLNPNVYNIIPVSDDNFEHIYRIKDALDKKEYVCFQGDRFVSEKTAIHTEFMGKRAGFPEGPFLLAARFNVPVVFYFAMREKGLKYRFSFHIAESSGSTRSSLEKDNILQQYLRVLEKTLYRYPEQWFNYYKFWDE